MEITMKNHIPPILTSPKQFNLKKLLKVSLQKTIRRLLKIPLFWRLTDLIYDEFKAEQKRIEQKILNLVSTGAEPEILDGPFRGMKYGEKSVGGALLPKLIGSYEKELSNLVNSFVSKNYDNVVDIGSAEGYYVVGLARMLKDAKIIAFDIDPEAHRLCYENAVKNNVADKITFKNYCSAEELSEVIQKKTLVICDCEGFEAEILNPVEVSKLEQCDILVELHDFIVPGVTELIKNRFKDTHRITLISEETRPPDDLPILETLKSHEKSIALSEKRSCQMKWAFIERTSC
ncbi:MAG: methyltransferase domain-containing protein [SAR324 cluster bacterium]|nr:methyltransferase domain-containing protein [SAR324 cluster bacterium]